ncbi:MAG TPA: putative quinol monooxygenase [Caulobacteraceae bacterium]
MGKFLMLIVAGTVRLPAENLDRARPVMEAMATATRAEDGCLEYAYAEDVLEPGLIRVFERWRDRPALDRHLQADHLKVWRAAWPDLGLHDRKLSAYEAGEPLPT